MPFKPHGSCKTCLLVKTDKKLLERINRSRQFIPTGEPLTVICKDIGVNYQSLWTHVKKHQAPNQRLMEKRQRQADTREALKEIQTVDTARTVSIYTGQAEMRKELLAKGMEALEQGDIRMGMSHIVSLLGQEQKAEENAKDRGLEMMKMFNYFASGASGGAAPAPTPTPATPTAAPRTDVVEGEVV